jgi:hypothetical protein
VPHASRSIASIEDEGSRLLALRCRSNDGWWETGAVHHGSAASFPA